MYTPLNPARRQIRLTSILPGRWSDRVVCKLTVVSLDDNPSYEALSYTWGDPSDKVPITLEGQPFGITKNLHMALRRLRQADTPRRIWVDAICINQSDRPEKSKQIQLMKEIYTDAREVQVYLGESRVLDTIPEEEQNAWNDPPRTYWFGDNRDTPMLNEYGTWQTLTDDQLSRLNPTTRLRQAISSAYTILDLLAEARCLRNLFLHHTNPRVWAETLSVLQHIASSSWWTRVWVVEEVILPEKATTIYGEVVAPLDIVERGGSMINCHVERCCREFYQTLPDDQQACLRAIAQHTEALEKLRQDRHKYADSEANRLQMFLGMTRARGAYNPRDKIYSLLGLTRDCVDPLSIVPDYTLAVARVYIDTAFKIIRHQNSLEVLLTVERKDTGSDIPTWCPDWSRSGNGEENDLWVHSRSWKFDAGPANGIVAELHHDRVLAVRGVVVDVVAATTLPLSQDEELAPRLDEFARMVGYDPEADDPYVGGGTVKEAFWRTMLNDALEAEPNLHQPLMADDRTVFLWWWNDLRTRMIGLHHPLQAHLMIIARSFWLPNDNRAFFITQQGYMGFGPPDMKQGDTMAVVLGSRMPLILRQMSTPVIVSGSEAVEDQSYHSLVGYCYLRGVMQGQAVGESVKVCGINLV